MFSNYHSLLKSNDSQYILNYENTDIIKRKESEKKIGDEKISDFFKKYKNRIYRKEALLIQKNKLIN